MDPKTKLKQKLQNERLKRGTTQSKRSFLEKKKVPEELIDSCLNRLNRGGSLPDTSMIQNLLQQVQSMSSALPKTPNVSTPPNETP
jgi:hypothetical protein